MKKKKFDAKDLRIVFPAGAFRIQGEPPLIIGDVVRLNSGGPLMLVVDADGGGVVVATRGGQEHTLPAACVHRARDIW